MFLQVFKPEELQRGSPGHFALHGNSAPLQYFPQIKKKERSKGWAKRKGESRREKAQWQTRRGKLAALLCRLIVLFKQDAPFEYFMS